MKEPNLLVLAEPGARAGFVGNWLMGTLKESHYDVGIELGHTHFLKKHYNGANQDEFTGIIDGYYSIAVISDFDKLDLLLKLYYDKCISDNSTTDINEVLVGLLSAAERYIANARKLDRAMFDDTIKFSDTFNQERLNEIYYKFNKSYPTKAQIKIAEETNRINTIDLDDNHPCSVIKELLTYDAYIYPRVRRFNAWEYCDSASHLAEIREMLNVQNYGKIKDNV